MKATFSTKAGTLADLDGKLKHARIPPLIFFQVIEWKEDRKGCLERIGRELQGDSFIVRSSCRREDGTDSSNAGAFLSLANVSTENIEESILKVIDAYGEPDPCDEVLVQPMLENVVRSGVAFSHDPNTCSPYRVVNWNEGEDTAAVTGGLGGSVWQHAASSPVDPPESLAEVFAMLEELYELFDEKPLDCEFAMTSRDN
mgnify:FL=1